MLEVSSDVDELPTDVDAALEADDVLSASAGRAARPKAIAAAHDRAVLFKGVGMAWSIKVVEGGAVVIMAGSYKALGN